MRYEIQNENETYLEEKLLNAQGIILMRSKWKPKQSTARFGRENIIPHGSMIFVKPFLEMQLYMFTHQP